MHLLCCAVSAFIYYSISSNTCIAKNVPAEFLIKIILIFDLICVQFYLLLSPYLSFLYLDLFVLGDDTFIS